jgi:hypothetical protein
LQRLRRDLRRDLDRRLQQSPHRRVAGGEGEELEPQHQTVVPACSAQIVPPHEAVDHPVDFAGRPAEAFCDLGLGQAVLGLREQFENVEALVERRRPVSAEILGHGAETS